MTDRNRTNPFPGFDPYLERWWGSVHATLLVYVQDDLQPRLPDGLFARVEQHVSLESTSDFDEDLSRYPDVGIVDDLRETETSTADSGAVVTTPMLLVREVAPSTRRYLAIVDHERGDRLVTAIEVLSPGNKDSERSRRLYALRQESHVAAGVNLVEIDLVRTGGYVLWPEWQDVEDHGPYRVDVVRSGRTECVEFYPAGLRDELPTIAVPLRPGEPDVALQLQSIVDRIHESGAYERSIDYTREPSPPLDADDAAWADELLKTKGLR